MKRISKTLQNIKGETLVESVVAFLIITIILLAFTAMALLGSKLNLNASTTDIAANAPQTETGASTASIGGQNYGVYDYGNDYISSYSTSGTIVPPIDKQRNSIIYYGIKYVFQGDGGKSVVDSGETIDTSSEASEIVQAMLNDTVFGNSYDLSKIGWKMIASKDGSTKYVDLFLYLKSPVTIDMVEDTLIPVYAYRYEISNWTDDTHRLTIEQKQTATITALVDWGNTAQTYAIMKIVSNPFG